MPRRDGHVPLSQMREYAAEAIEMARGRDRTDLDEDRMFMHAMTRLVEIVGEAAGRVPEGIQKQVPDIPWTDVVGMRHRLIHGYDAVNLTMLWETVQYDLPMLVDRLERLLADSESG